LGHFAISCRVSWTSAATFRKASSSAALSGVPTAFKASMASA